MKIVQLIGGSFLALGFALACGGMSNQAGGSNTNWFATCASSADCAGGLECWCGLCTTACATGCSSAGSAATCSEPPAACTDPSKKSACAVGCTNDADCASLGASAACGDGVCRKGTTTTKTDGGTKSCSDLSSQAFAKVQTLDDGADQSCKTTADCIAAPDVSCGGGCGHGTTSKAGAAAIASGLASIEKTYCEPFAKQGCMTIALPCAFPGNPTCIAGKCQDAPPGQPTDSGTASCDDQAQRVDDQLNAALDALDKSCKMDADCTRVQADVQCDFGCNIPVSKTAAAAFAATRPQIERDTCAPYLGAGCMPLLTGCPNSPGDAPKCLKGVCTDVFTTTTSDAGAGTCADRTAQLNAALQPVVDGADKKCSVDADCKTVMLVNQCMESCTYAPASATGATAIQNELDAIDSNSCGAFAAAGCTVTRLPCVAPPTPKCSAGTCTAP